MLICGGRGHQHYLSHVVSLDANVCDADSAVKSQLCLSQQRRVMQRTREWRPFAYKEHKTEATEQIKAHGKWELLDIHHMPTPHY